MPRTLRLVIALCGLTLALTDPSLAEVPHVLNFQGRLKDSTGTPYSGSKLVKFSIYDSLDTEIWTSGLNSETFSGGLVNVLLGAAPQPPLPTAAILGDTSLTLGITVDTDPEIVPRLPLVSSAWAIHAGDADRVDGLEGTSFVQEAGDTMSGSLTVLGDLSVGTDTSIAPITLESQDKWIWSVGDGWGDLRLGNDVMGFNIGVALGGAGAGATRMWTRGGYVEDIYFGGPTNGDLLRLEGLGDEVELRGKLLIGTGTAVAPLNLQSQNQTRWDVGSGLGDFRLSNGAAGLSMGVTSTGDAAIWSGGGASEQIRFGGPTGGEIFQVDGMEKRTMTHGHSWWIDSLGQSSIKLSPYPFQGVQVYGDTYPAGSMYSMENAGWLTLNDSGWLSVSLLAGARGRILLQRKRPTDLESFGVWLDSGDDSAGGTILVHDGLGFPKIRLLADNDSDDAVILPTASINHDEILDEPGIAFKRMTTGLSSLSPSSNSIDFEYVTITTPANGYIVVEGVGYFRCTGSGAAFGWVQISDTSNQSRESEHAHWVGPNGFGNTLSSYTYQSIPVRRYYFKSAGTYTFYLQGNAWSGNDVNSDIDLLAPSWLQATYYPASYGPVSTVAASPEGFESATPVAIADPQTGETATAYQVDLRELELKAARARADAEKAERELLEEKLRLGILENERQKPPDVDLASSTGNGSSKPK